VSAAKAKESGPELVRMPELLVSQVQKLSSKTGGTGFRGAAFVGI
jgi:hypothetical protein